MIGPVDYYKPLDPRTAAAIQDGADHCPECNGRRTQVIDSRVVAERKERQRRRRKVCADCGWRWTTVEIPRARLLKLESAQKSLAAIDRAIVTLQRMRAALIGDTAIEGEEET